MKAYSPSHSSVQRATIATGVAGRPGRTHRCRGGRPLTALVWTLLLLSGLLSASAVYATYIPSEEPSTRLEDLLSKWERPPFGSSQSRPSTKQTRIDIDRLRQFYVRRYFAPLWVRADGVSDKARAVIRVLQQAGVYGLNPARYRVEYLKARLDATDSQSLVEFESALTLAYVRYASHLRNGRLDEPLHPAHRAYRGSFDPVEFLRQASRADDPARLLRAQHPTHGLYTGLRQALARYRHIAAEGGWPQVPAGTNLSRGDRDPRIITVRRRLRATGDYAAGRGAREYFEATLAEAVKRFQSRHGLKVDGIVGPATHAALNVPAVERVRQLALNLERARWLPHQLGDRYVLVNIAGFHARVVENGKTRLRMRVIVGKRYQQTPAFSDKIRYLDLNPYWNVPRSIARNEILPAVVDDPGYLARNNLEVLSGWETDPSVVDPQRVDWQAMQEGRFPYRFRQRPGPANALGRIKFMFPNEFSVYMHDTPSRHLFERDSRTFSHGCIRVARPLALAQYLLKEQGWSRSRLERTIDRGDRRVISLRDHMPVHVTYLSAWAGDENVYFRSDVYDRDTRLAKALFTAGPADKLALP